MGTTRKTITVTDQQDSWIKTQIEAGEFTNDSEYIRDLIRRDQAGKSEILAIRSALIEGEKSGLSGRTPEDVKQRAKNNWHYRRAQEKIRHKVTFPPRVRR